MLPLAVSGFSEQQVRDALLYRYGANTLRGRYELLDANRVFKADITEDIISCDITLNALATIKRTANIAFRESADYEVNYLADHIRVYVQVLVDYTAPGNPASWAEWPYGTFLLVAPIRDSEGVFITRPIQCFDRGLILTEDSFDDRYTVIRSQKYTDAVKDILQGALITAFNIQHSDKEPAEDIEWLAGTEKIRAINDMLVDRINYYSLSFDEMGVAVGSQYIDPANRSVDFAHDTGQRTSIVFPNISQERDAFKVPNLVTVAAASPDDPNINFLKRATNVNPASDTSIPSRNRRIVRVESRQAPDEATTQAMADRLLLEASMIYESIPHHTTFLPYQELDKIRFIDSDLGIDADYILVSATLDLTNGGGEMNCRIRRVVTV